MAVQTDIYTDLNCIVMNYFYSTVISGYSESGQKGFWLNPNNNKNHNGSSVVSGVAGSSKFYIYGLCVILG